MRVPADCKVTISVVRHAGVMRPRVFYCIEVESAELGGIKIPRYVLARSFIAIPFLRIRLFLALLECLRMVRKVKKFVAVQGIKLD